VQQSRILVVDDNPGNLKLFTLLLLSPRYEVQTAMSAQLALDVLTGFHPDLILLDLQLPDMDGLELTRRLKADPVRRSIPIVVVTAYAMKGDEERARAAGADHYISKPVDKNVFRQVVAQLLERGGMNEGANRA
jgi:two-component system, cell cycle response regulator DivK